MGLLSVSGAKCYFPGFGTSCCQKLPPWCGHNHKIPLKGMFGKRSVRILPFTWTDSAMLHDLPQDLYKKLRFAGGPLTRKLDSRNTLRTPCGLRNANCGRLQGSILREKLDRWRFLKK